MDRVKSLINTLVNEMEKGADSAVLLGITEELRTTLHQKMPASGSKPNVSVWLPGGLPKPHVSQPVSAAPRPVLAEPEPSPLPLAGAQFTALRPPAQILATDQTPPPNVMEREAAENLTGEQSEITTPVPVAAETTTTLEKMSGIAPSESPAIDAAPLPVITTVEQIAPVVHINSVQAVQIEEELEQSEMAADGNAEEPVIFNFDVAESPVQEDSVELPSIMELVVDITEEELAGIEEEEKSQKPVHEFPMATARISVEDIWTKAKSTPAREETNVELNEKIARRTMALNELFERRSPELAEVLAEPRVNDLRKAISINDKYQFINSLFRGEEDMFERSLKTLNNFGTLPEAQYWMQRELMIKLGWNDEDELVQKFCRLVARRFT